MTESHLRPRLRFILGSLLSGALLLTPVRGADDDAGKSTVAPKAQPVNSGDEKTTGAPKALPVKSGDDSDEKSAPKALPAPTSDDLDAINASAKGLAAMPNAGGNAWESTSEWKSYKHEIDDEWSYLDRVRLTAMRSWAAAQLGDLRQQGTVFYPFSGPDALYADTLFPNSKTLLMAGLEPVGTMPDLAKLKEQGKLGPYLDRIKTSLFTILAASFFKTKDMKVDFNSDGVDGLVPDIAVFVARQGYTIEDLQYVTLDHDGDVHPHGEASGAPGVKFTYGGGRTLYYFQADLGNDGLKKNPGFVNFMHKLAPGVTYLKAASYLLYEDYFSTIRDAILEDSVGVVEDDSGIPFHDFKQDKWQVIPYGDYTGPIGLFKERDQPDLHAYYAKTPHEQLPFGCGYKFHPSVSSLLVVKKKS